MNVIQVNIEANMSYGWMIVFIHLIYGWKNWIYIFLIYKTPIKIMDECFILSWSSYQ
jgi:hypothetical protein